MTLVSLLHDFDIKEVFARYNTRDPHVSGDFLLYNNFIIHLTRYFNQPMVVYSVEKEDHIIACGYCPIENFDTKFIKDSIESNS